MHTDRYSLVEDRLDVHTVVGLLSLEQIDDYYMLLTETIKLLIP